MLTTMIFNLVGEEKKTLVPELTALYTHLKVNVESAKDLGSEIKIKLTNVPAPARRALTEWSLDNEVDLQTTYRKG